MRVDGKLLPTGNWPRLDRFKEHNIELPVGACEVTPKREQELRDLKNEAWIISPEMRAQKIQEQIGQVEQGLLDTGADRSAMKAQVETLRKLAAGLPEKKGSTNIL